MRYKPRILLVHNYYGRAAPSGENRVFALERALLEANGHDIEVYQRFSDEIRASGMVGLVHGAVTTAWNPLVARGLRRVIDRFRPDIMHVHNVFPLISAAVFPAAIGRVARVLTLHNYRLFCANAIPVRQGKVCPECLDRRSIFPAIRYGCYRESRLATIPVATGIALHRLRGTWQKDVEAFIALTAFQRQRMVAAGLPADRVHIKPNFYPGLPDVVQWDERVHRVLYAGRLSVEKGVEYLVDAWHRWGADAPDLWIVGDGPLRTSLEARARSCGGRIRFLGQVDGDQAEALVRTSRLLVLPSICFEGFPLVVREALAFGTPVAVSALGPLPEFTDQGRAGAVFTPGSADELFAVVRRLWGDQAQLSRMGCNARRLFETRYTAQANYEQLMQIYEHALRGIRGNVHA